MNKTDTNQSHSEYVRCAEGELAVVIEDTWAARCDYLFGKVGASLSERGGLRQAEGRRGFPHQLSGEESRVQCNVPRRAEVDPWVRRSWEEGMW